MVDIEAPYVGPIPFGPENQNIFFGRDTEANELLSLIIANRIVLLYAKSGAGKTSLLQARVIPDLVNNEGFEVLPVTRVKGLIPASIEPTSIANLYVFNLIQSLSTDPIPLAVGAQIELRDYLRSLKRRSDQFGDALPRVLIIDQFEELFNLYPDRWNDREGLFRQINSAMESDPQLRIVLGMREDYIAHLDSYTKILSDGIRARFRLELLREQSALDAIAKPAELKGRKFQKHAAKILVEELRKERGETSTGQTEEVRGEYIEPVQLQIVCSRLWTYFPSDAKEITSSHVEEYGNVDEALAEFYSDCLHKASQSSKMNERRLGIWIEKNLITPASTRGTIYGGHGLDDPTLRNALIHLAELHLLRVEWRSGSPWYELAHDRFISPIKNVNNKPVDSTSTGRRIRRRVSLFLSSAHTDQAFTNQLYQSLMQDGFDVFWDRERMPSHKRALVQELQHAIDTADKLVLILSPNALQSDYVRAEWDYGFSLCKPVIPILVSGDYGILPDEFISFHIPDFRNQEEYELRLEELVRIAETSEDIPGELYNVPPLPSNYTPRIGALAGLSQQLIADITNPTTLAARNQIIALQGMAGVGKSVLVSALAQDCTVRKAFPDGIFWCEIGKSPNLLSQIMYIGMSFGDDRSNYDDLERATIRLRLLLASKAVLLILDDIWQPEHIRPFQVTGPRSRILITTRSEKVAIELEAKIDSLPLMTLAESVAMLKTYLPTVTDEALRQLGRALGGHALSLELAARRMQKERRPGESEEQKVARLITEYEKGLPGGDPFASIKLELGEQKEDNLTLSLYMSYEALASDDRRRFRMLGVLAYDAPLSVDLLGAIWEESHEAVYDHADPLRLLALLGIKGDGYHQHPLLRAYARALLVQAGEIDNAFGRYADFIIQITRIFDTLPPEQWDTNIIGYYPHVLYVGDELAAHTQTITTDQIHRRQEFAFNIRNYLFNRREVQRQVWLEMGLQTARMLQKDTDQIVYYQQRETLFLNELGLMWSALGEQRKALEFYEQALQLKHIVGDRNGEATTLNNIGSAWSDLGETRRALHYYQQALPLAQVLQDRHSEAITLNNLGKVWDSLGERGKALGFYQQALKVFRMVEDRSGEAIALNNLGSVWDSRGQKRKALEFYEQALPLRRAVGDQSGEAATLNNLGSVWDSLGEKRKALEFYEQALPLRRVVGDRSGEATTLNNIGKAWDDLGEKSKALDFYEQALSLSRLVGNRENEATVLNNMSLIYFQLGSLEKSVQMMRQVVNLTQDIGNVESRVLYTHNLVIMLQRMGHLDEASSLLEDAIVLLLKNSSSLISSEETIERYKNLLAEIKSQNMNRKANVVQTHSSDTMRSLLQLYSQSGIQAVREDLRSINAPEIMIGVVIRLIEKYLES